MDNKSKYRAFQELDAIALGVEVRLGSLLGYSELITRKTIESAQNMGIPKSAVQRWSTERDRRIKKLEDITNGGKKETQIEVSSSEI